MCQVNERMTEKGEVSSGKGVKVVNVETNNANFSNKNSSKRKRMLN